MAKIKLFYIVFIVAAFLSIAAVSKTWFGNMHVSTDQVTFAWEDTSTGVDYYEIQLWWVDQDPPMLVDTLITEEKQIVVERPRTGHFYFTVRGCNDTECSDWASSTTAEDCVDSIPFRIYFAVPPVGPIIIE